MRDRLIVAENDKKRILQSKTVGGSSSSTSSKDEKWRRDVKFEKTFDGKANESIEQHLRDLKFALQKAKVFNEEQKESILLQSLGDLCTLPTDPLHKINLKQAAPPPAPTTAAPLRIRPLYRKRETRRKGCGLE
eukprot:SAG11_NODE_12330_length_708_cov_1.981938_1_plen_133_part_10